MTADKGYDDAMLNGLLRLAATFTAQGLDRLEEPARSQGALLRRLILIQCTPLHARLFIVSGDDIHEIWRSFLPEDAATVVGGFVATGLRQMEPDDARNTLALVEEEKADIFVTVEPHAASARAVCIRRGDDLKDAVEMFTLQTAGRWAGA